MYGNQQWWSHHHQDKWEPQIFFFAILIVTYVRLHVQNVKQIDEPTTTNTQNNWWGAMLFFTFNFCYTNCYLDYTTTMIWEMNGNGLWPTTTTTTNNDKNQWHQHPPPPMTTITANSHQCWPLTPHLQRLKMHLCFKPLAFFFSVFFLYHYLQLGYMYRSGNNNDKTTNTNTTTTISSTILTCPTATTTTVRPMGPIFHPFYSWKWDFQGMNSGWMNERWIFLHLIFSIKKGWYLVCISHKAKDGNFITLQNEFQGMFLISLQHMNFW